MAASIDTWLSQVKQVRPQTLLLALTYRIGEVLHAVANSHGVSCKKPAQLINQSTCPILFIQVVTAASLLASSCDQITLVPEPKLLILPKELATGDLK